MTELYIGLATIEAAVFGIYVAGLFVLVQVSAAQFSSRLLRPLLDRWTTRLLAALALLTASVAVLGAIRSAFPGSDVIGALDFRTDDIFLDHPYAAIGLAIAIFITVAGCSLALYHLTGWLNPSAMLRRAISQVDFDEWCRYADYRFPSPSAGKGTDNWNRLNADVESGQLNDPFAPMVELLLNATKEYQYHNTALGIQLMENWTSRCTVQRKFYTDDHSSAADKRTHREGEPLRCANLLAEYLNALSQTARASSHRSVIGLCVESASSLSRSFLENGYAQPAGRLLDFLIGLGELLDGDRDDENLTLTIDALCSLALASIEIDHSAVFDNSARALGYLGERIATRLIPQRRVLALMEQQPYPISALENAFAHISDGLCPRRASVKFEPKMFCDAIYATTSSLLCTHPASDDLQEHANNFVGNLGALAIAAATQPNERALWLACLTFEDILKHARDVGARRVTEWVVGHLFEAGLIANASTAPFDGKNIELPQQPEDLADIVLHYFTEAELGDIISAKRDLYLRGHTAQYLDQPRFLQRLAGCTNHPEILDPAI